MSYELRINEKQRAGSRFIAKVSKALTIAALDAREKDGVTQQSITQKLGMKNRSVINRWLRGGANLTLRTVAEIAWALGLEIVFELRRKGSPRAKSNVSGNQTTIVSDNVESINAPLRRQQRPLPAENLEDAAA
jgi:transcriptional regulator with XRE-family HTH domain